MKLPNDATVVSLLCYLYTVSRNSHPLDVMQEDSYTLPGCNKIRSIEAKAISEYCQISSEKNLRTTGYCF